MAHVEALLGLLFVSRCSFEYLVQPYGEKKRLVIATHEFEHYGECWHRAGIGIESAIHDVIYVSLTPGDEKNLKLSVYIHSSLVLDLALSNNVSSDK